MLMRECARMRGAARGSFARSFRPCLEKAGPFVLATARAIGFLEVET